MGEVWLLLGLAGYAALLLWGLHMVQSGIMRAYGSRLRQRLGVGLANRRRFDEVLLTEWQRATRSRQPLGLAMLDVDWFKHYNDAYGHQAGDECLRMVARVLQTQVRRVSDLVARYGGEEFALIVPETSAENMLSLAKALQTALEALALPHAESVFGHVTVSIGIAVQVPTVDATPEQLLQRADAALYRAKIEGRNRIAG